MLLEVLTLFSEAAMHKRRDGKNKIYIRDKTITIGSWSFSIKIVFSAYPTNIQFSNQNTTSEGKIQRASGLFTSTRNKHSVWIVLLRSQYNTILQTIKVVR